jgi:alpha-tubulin suppressor-like RCC1 family protein
VVHFILFRFSAAAAIGAFILGCGGDSTSPPAATKLAFAVQPSLVAAGVAIAPAVQVRIQDAQGNTVTGANTGVRIDFAPGTAGASLLGAKSVNAVAGVATFTDLAVDIRGTDFSLVATAPGSQQATSDPFSVFLATFDVLSAGGGFVCGIAVAHSYCWGTNGIGQLGDGSTTQRLNPVLASTGQIFAVVDAGFSHACALTAAGSAYCWGDNGSGQLGDGSGIARLAPTPVSGGLTFASISAGGSHTCGVTTAGVAYCWGSGFKGQLGDGATTVHTSPVAVAGGLSFTAISAGIEHTCGLTTAHVAYCWGLNDGGELGDGTNTRTATPTQVAGGLSFGSIGAGSAYTCAVTTSSATYCWGTNTSGQLGDGTTFYRNTPTPVGGSITFASVAVGYVHTCAITSTGVAYCWGENGLGQLGDGARSSPKPVPTPVTDGLSFRSLSLGRFYTCGVTTAGLAYCWGDNSSGMFGDGTMLNDSATPKRAGL